MKILIRYVSFLVLFYSFVSCVPHRSYVASPYEPLLVEKKGDVQISAAFRPWKYYSAELTLAPADFFAIRVGYGGFFGLNNFSASIPFFKAFRSNSLFVAPGINYQRNVIDRRIGTVFANNQKVYKYDCEYTSPNLVVGYRLKIESDISIQFILKTQYNFVQRYQYAFEKNNGSGRTSYFVRYDDEVLNTKIPNFFSFEPSIAMLAPINHNFSFKFQTGLSICQKVLVHKYQFIESYYTITNVDKVGVHPRTLFLNIGFGIIFQSHFLKKKIGA